MSSLIKGSSLRRLQLGEQVIKAAQVLPQTATKDLFAVTGGAILVTSLLGLITTAIASTDPVLSLGTKPTVGTAEPSGLAVTEPLTSFEVGTWLGLSDASMVAGTPDVYTLGKILAGGHAGNVVPICKPFVVSAGTITWTTTGSRTGAIKWYATYVPLDDGAFLS
jgi:hypothetical protein